MLFQPYTLGDITLRNRIVMAPMTRSRATSDNVPTPIMADYYAQRAGVGLIVTEGTSPSPDGLGYPRIPGLFNAAQVEGWKTVTEAVHAKGGRIFVQLMHTGRAAATANLPAGARVVGSTAHRLGESMFTDTEGMQPAAEPHPLTAEEIPGVVEEYAASARLAIEAGFDGVELHGANGYLIEQFLNANVNDRTDAWGGGAGGRNRFALEVARATAEAIGAGRLGIRISPYGVFNQSGAFEGVEEQYLELVRELSDLGLAYLHLVNHASMGAPEVPGGFISRLREAFDGTFIVSGGLDREKAEALLATGAGDLFAFGRPVLANPDFVARIQDGAPLNNLDPDTFYTPGAVGYTDYPVMAG